LKQVFYHIFEQLPRVGPGNYDSTKKAFNIVRQSKALPEKPEILDIGSGTGIHTVHLAKLSNSHITALDNHQEFMESLQRNAKIQGVTDNITCVPGDMAAMNFESHWFDIIWAEGSIFIVGLENGLTLWKKYLKAGGMMALTDVFWLKPGAPDELKEFFKQTYPAMMDIEEAKRVIEACGYHLTDYFQLPESAWWDDFYRPLEHVLKDCHRKYADNPDALVLINALDKEIDMYRKYSDYYGYIFFILENK